MIDFDCEEVKRQLNRLHERLPHDDVAIWIQWKQSDLEYTVYIDSRDQFPSHCGNALIVIDAVTEAISKAGTRRGQDLVTLKREAIEKARIDLAKLESELDPLIMAIDKAQADLEKPPTTPPAI